jgi:hypothetical protein
LVQHFIDENKNKCINCSCSLIHEIKQYVLAISNFEEPEMGLTNLINMKIEARDRKNKAMCAPATISNKKSIFAFKKLIFNVI